MIDDRAAATPVTGKAVRLLTPDELSAIAQRADAATPPPWLAVNYETHPEEAGKNWDITDDPAWGITTDCVPMSEVSAPADDYAFLAHARQDIPALLDALAAEQEANTFAELGRQLARDEMERYQARNQELEIALAAAQAEAAALRAERDAFLPAGSVAVDAGYLRALERHSRAWWAWDARTGRDDWAALMQEVASAVAALRQTPEWAGKEDTGA